MYRVAPNVIKIKISVIDPRGNICLSFSIVMEWSHDLQEKGLNVVSWVAAEFLEAGSP